jgi:hypothetical protein
MNIVSGTPFSLNVTIRDLTGTIYNVENSAIAEIEFTTTPTNGMTISNNKVQANDGWFRFKNVLIIAQPSEKLGLQITVSNIQSFGNTIDFVKTP